MTAAKKPANHRDAEAELDAYVAAVVADWPPLTPEQRDRVALLLAPTDSLRDSSGGFRSATTKSA